MIQSLRIGNFKAFGDTQEIPIRPITLIFGPNSAGKSSIVHSLALAHHATRANRAGDMDVHRTSIGGDSIDLGGFHQYVHRRDPGRRVEWTVTLDPRQMPGKIGEAFASVHTVAMQLFIGASNDGHVGVQACALLADDAPFLTMSARGKGQLRIDRLDSQNPLVGALFDVGSLTGVAKAELGQDVLVAMAEVIANLLPEIGIGTRRLLPQLQLAVAPEQGILGFQLLEAIKSALPLASNVLAAEQRHEILVQITKSSFVQALHTLIDGMSGTVRAALGRLSYLGPLRSYPPRHLLSSPQRDTNWRAGGGYAWDVLRRSEDVRKAVNTWLLSPERLSTPYEIVVRPLVPASQLDAALKTRLAKALHDAVARMGEQSLATGASDLQALAQEHAERIAALDPDDPTDLIPEIEEMVASLVDTDETAARWVREIEADVAGTLHDLVLVDRRTDTVVTHRDVGIGVSQVLPVLVNAYSARERLVAIEQPEIHLHPALQAELGDVFIESALGERRNTFLLETHSEHLILRLLRRIRETTEDELAPGLQSIGPEDVAVLYVEPTPRGSRVLEIPVTEDGEFARSWPHGFFAERVRELM